MDQSGGKLFWTSTASERVIGYTREECMAMPSVLETIAHDEDRARLRHALDHAIERAPLARALSFAPATSVATGCG